MELVAGVDFLTYVRPQSLGETWKPGPSPRPCRCPKSYSPPDRAPLLGSSRACHVRRTRRASAQRPPTGGRSLRTSHAGTLHRDIKPSNVLVTREGRVVILDFGLIAEMSAEGSGQFNSRAGTPAYMAPEQTAGLPPAEAADWYAVGVMLFESLTGRRPFTGTTSELIARKQHFDAPDASELATGVPEDLDALCRDLLRREPQLRPTGKDVLSRLGSLQTSLPGQPARAPFVGRERQLEALTQALASVRVRGGPWWFSRTVPPESERPPWSTAS